MSAVSSELRVVGVVMIAGTVGDRWASLLELVVRLRLPVGGVATPSISIVSASFGQYAEEAYFAVEYAAYVGGGDIGVVPEL